MSKAARSDQLEALHATVATVLAAQLAGDDVSPQMLAQAIKFLKDNGVEPARDVDNSALDSLAKQIQSFKDGNDDPDLVYVTKN